MKQLCTLASSEQFDGPSPPLPVNTCSAAAVAAGVEKSGGGGARGRAKRGMGEDLAQRQKRLRAEGSMGFEPMSP